MALPSPGRVASIVRRDLLITSSYRMAFVLDLTLGVISVFVYYFISETLRIAEGQTLDGAPNYFSFAAVGVVVTMVIQGASTGVTRKIREEQLTGTLEVLTTYPTTPAEIALGLGGFPFLFAVVRALIYLGVAAAFLSLDVASASWLGFAVMMLLTGLTLSSVGIFVGAVVVVVNRGEVLAPLVAMALGFFGGAYFPIDALPGWAEFLGNMTPTHYIFEGTREALFTGAGWSGDALALVPYCLLALPASIVAFSAAISRARRRGTLGQY